MNPRKLTADPDILYPIARLQLFYYGTYFSPLLLGQQRHSPAGKFPPLLAVRGACHEGGWTPPLILKSRPWGPTSQCLNNGGGSYRSILKVCVSPGFMSV